MKQILIFILLIQSISGKAQLNPFDTLPLLLSDDIRFEFGMAELNQDAQSTLSHLLDEVDANKARFYLTAHTDSIGTEQNNELLAVKRAANSQAYLLSNLVSAQNIYTHSYGEQKPIAPNRTDTGRELNRRVEISVHYPQEMVNVRGRVFDKVSNKGIETTVLFHAKNARDSTRSDSAGYFQKQVAKGAVVGLDIMPKGYIFDNTIIKIDENVSSKLDFGLSQISSGEIFELKNLYFIGNKAKLDRRSIPDLERLNRFLKMHPEIRIEIGGHVNRPNQPKAPKFSWEYDLSLRRAEMVKDFLLKKDVDPDRMKAVGYANWKMKFPKPKNSSEMSKNMRVEIKIFLTEDEFKTKTADN